MSNNNNNKNTQYRRRNKPNGKKKPKRLTVQARQNQLYAELGATRYPRGMLYPQPFPPQMIRGMPFFQPTYVLASAVNPYVVKEWRLNSVYQPEFTGPAGVGVAGYVEMAAIYGSYFVTYFTLEAELTSNEPALPITCCFIFKDQQPSLAITSYQRAVNSMEVGPCSQAVTLGTTQGMSTHRFKKMGICPGTVIGNQLQYHADSEYAATSGANPNQIVWLAVVLTAPTSGGTVPNGVILNLRMIFTTKWYGTQTQYLLNKERPVRPDQEQYWAKRQVSRSM